MVNLLNPELRTRDLRKLVEPNFYKVHWEIGVDETSEWVLASLENEKYQAKLSSWLKSKKIDDNFEAICVDPSWSNLYFIKWQDLYEDLDVFFTNGNKFIISANRSWILEFSSEQIVRFGRW